MSYLNWHVGMKVVCIKRDAWSSSNPSEAKPVYGGVYTIRTIEAVPAGVCLRFNEIRNPEILHLEGFNECQFLADRFRPVQTRPTSIEVFNRILLNPHIRISEDA